jgi:NADH:ubiquinone reductase (H+-translocating)
MQIDHHDTAGTTIPPASRRPRVVIAGGGFGGLYAALELERALARGAGIDVTLVNKDNFFLFTPMLHEVAASDIDITNIVSPVRALLRRVHFIQGDIEAIDTGRRVISVAHGAHRHSHDLSYDCLVVALGSTTNFHGLPGLEQHALTMKTLGDAIHLRNKVIAHLEEADVEADPELRRTLLTFVVAGGGFAGVETAASVYDFVLDSLRFYPNLRKEDVRLALVHSGQVLLPELGPELGQYAQQKLRARGLDVITGARVASVTHAAVSLSTGATVASRFVVWTAGTSPNPLLGSITANLSNGRLMVNEHLEVQGADRVWALGDCAAVPNAATGGLQPPTAQHALREGRVAARNVLAALGHGRRTAFHFGGLGQLAAIGKRTGVAKVFGVRFSGFPAWWLWRTVYLLKLPRFEKKLRVAFDWTLDLFFSKDIVQFLTVREEAHAGEAQPGEARTAAVHADAAPAPEAAEHAAV